jgi:ATP-dependent DNA helicase RecQ
MMRGFAELGQGCRRAFVLSYFGESRPDPCGNCDMCEAGLGDSGATEEPYAIGGRVRHREWGVGMVQRYEPGEVVVLFDEAGYKTLDLGLVRERGLLEDA